jgi:cyclopropane fatty-acyl-phospholipid synthase-like methyltransferase
MKNNYKIINEKFWNRVYHAPNVEGFIFRLKSRLLDLFIKKKKLKVLDYGCGEGSNINYLIKKYGYDGYGVDISEPSIKICQKINKKKFKLIDFDVNQNDNFFNIKFDLIISIQTLYFLNDIDLQNRLISLNKMLKPGGYVFFTMQSTKNEYYKYFCDKRKNNDGLYKVDLSSNKNYKKRQKQSIYYHYINFTKSEKDLKNKFRLFKPLKIGYYDGSLTSTNESLHHFTFFGKKK